jgi:hypothetical protein
VFNYHVGLALRSWDRKFFVTTLMISSIGVRTVVRLALAIALNIWMVSRVQMTHLQYSYAVVSGVIVLLLAWPTRGSLARATSDETFAGNYDARNGSDLATSVFQQTMMRKQPRPSGLDSTSA